MTTTVPSNRENIAQWSAMSPDQIAALDPEGDFARKHLLNPTMLRMMGDVEGRRVLDAGAGQGYFSRMLARNGAVVTSVEPADAFIAHSLGMERREPLGIDYVHADLTEFDVEPSFDVVVSSMVFCSIDEWDRALATCVNALKPGGSLIFSVDHPCFEMSESQELLTDPHVLVRDYFTERPVARPVATDFHRTLSTYLNTVVNAGLSIAEVAEPGVAVEAAQAPDAPENARLMTRIPNFLIIKANKPT